MISGFNTDIEFGGVTYHVQTEDKGLATPFLLSLVYTRGEILAAKRAFYEDLIAAGFDEKVLAERLQKQHRLICAAIKQGRVEDLKRMSQRETATIDHAAVIEPTDLLRPTPRAGSIALPAAQIPEATPLELEPLLDFPIALTSINNGAAELLPEPPIDVQTHTVRVLRRESDDQVADFARAEAVPDDALNLSLLDEREFRGGDRAVLRVRLTHGDSVFATDVADARITVKVLGAAFRPIILQAATDENGLAVFDLQIPEFRAGRAALLIHAAHGGYEAELRRIVAQG